MGNPKLPTRLVNHTVERTTPSPITAQHLVGHAMIRRPLVHLEISAQHSRELRSRQIMYQCDLRCQPSAGPVQKSSLAQDTMLASRLILEPHHLESLDRRTQTTFSFKTTKTSSHPPHRVNVDVLGSFTQPQVHRVRRHLSYEAPSAHPVYHISRSSVNTEKA